MQRKPTELVEKAIERVPVGNDYVIITGGHIITDSMSEKGFDEIMLNVKSKRIDRLQRSFATGLIFMNTVQSFIPMGESFYNEVNGSSYINSSLKESVINFGGVVSKTIDVALFSRAYAEAISADIVSGGFVSETSVNDGVTQIVAGGTTEKTRVLSGGSQAVSAGLATSTLVSAGGIMEVVGGSASLASVFGKQVVTGGVVQSTTVENGGEQEIHGGTADLTDVKSGGTQTLFGSGVVISAILNSGATQIISGGLASDTAVNNGATQIVAGGTTEQTSVLSGGFQQVESGLATSTIVSSGGIQYVSGGTTTGAVINGIQEISGGGVVVSTMISEGGTQRVLKDEMVLATTIGSGALQEIISNGVAQSTYIQSGGTANIQSGGDSRYDIVEGIQNVSTSALVMSGIVSSGGIQNISGGEAHFVSIGNSGTQNVYGGSAFSVTIEEGGIQNVYGGSAFSVTIEEGGIQNVSGGTETDAVVSGIQNLFGNALASYDKISGVQNVADSAFVSNTSIYDGGTQNISGGTVTRTYANTIGAVQNIFGGTVLSTQLIGGTQNISGGTVITVLADNGGTQNIIDGMVSDTSIHNNAIQNMTGGTLTKAFLYDGTQNIFGGVVSNVEDYAGIQNIYGGTVSDVKIMYGTTQQATQNIYDGIVSNVSVIFGGLQVVNGGTVSDVTIADGGTQHVLGKVENTSILSLGSSFVSTGGTLNNTSITTGGEMSVDDGGTAQIAYADGGDVVLLSSGGAVLKFATVSQAITSVYNLTNLSATNDTIYLGAWENVSTMSPVGNTLHIGTMTGNANFVLNSDIANGVADYVKIDNAVGSSSNTVKFYDVGFNGTTISGTKTLFATAPQTVVSFTALKTEVGAYQYTPHVTTEDVGADTNWYIDQLAVSTSATSSGGGGGGGISSSGGGISSSGGGGSSSSGGVSSSGGESSSGTTSSGGVNASSGSEGNTTSGGINTSNGTGAYDGNNGNVANGGTDYFLSPSETVLTARDSMANLYGIFRNMNEGVSNRLAEARSEILDGKSLPSEKITTGIDHEPTRYDNIWTKISHSRDTLKYDDNRRSKSSQTDIEFGADETKIKGKTAYVYGMSIDINNASVTFSRGYSEPDGAVATAYGEIVHSDGQFLEGMIRAGRLSQDVTSYLDNGINTRVDMDYDTTVAGINLKYGKRSQFGKGFYIEPKVGLSYSYLSGSDMTASDGTNIKVNGISSLIGRLSVETGQNLYGTTQWYARLGVAREFTAKVKAEGWSGNLPHVGSESSLKDTILEISTGIRGKLSDSTTGYLDFGMKRGHHSRQNYSVRCGITVKF